MSSRKRSCGSRFDVVIVAAGHRLVVHQCMTTASSDGLDHACEKRIHQIIRNCFNGVRHLIRIRDVGISVGKAMNKIPEPLPNCSRSRKPKGHAPG